MNNELQRMGKEAVVAFGNVLSSILLKMLKNHEIFVKDTKYLGSILTNDGRCTCEIKCRIAMAKAAFNKKRALFIGTLDLDLRKKLVKCYI